MWACRVKINTLSYRCRKGREGLNLFTLRMHYADFNYMIIKDNDSYYISQKQPLLLFLLWSSYCDVASPLVPREKVHVWTYNLPPWSTLLFLHLDMSQASPLSFLSHASSATLHLDYFPPPSQARSNSALVHLAMHQNSCSWQADKSWWFSTSICSFATALSSEENEIAFLSCPQAMTSVCLCLSQQDISPKNQFP